ncbi:hypothetical protein CC1G_13802 [Coprinopsis cinerea okayama7|uniref:F-box domain-containing protein n=1 Tax=Coprinopsis cinerea (strain Okayama-7 / 130 / ATCC MYA-4618 / FGSC 9003) TaxID=240176 RepID=D6RKD1_COPC7|nr:hypothetical protein CC1G_13802 [Coprinopsis cinerea okayama7\|eukprot:XP_002912271.1 hypothetical protein CC1G_13802 [Coprinopsis cinerea okayama7\
MKDVLLKLELSGPLLLITLLLVPWLIIVRGSPTFRWYKHRPQREPLQLSRLPHEILVEIMKNLEWDDVLNLRKVMYPISNPAFHAANTEFSAAGRST